jgi:acylpyruvate hydrolase
MRLATVRLGSETAACRVEDSNLTTLPFAHVGELLASGPGWREVAARPGGAVIEAGAADFAPLLPQPEKIACVGVNYQSHVDETGLDRPTYPTVFAKYGRALVGAFDPIEIPDNSECADWEVELGVVVGSPLRHASEDEALAAVAGYTIVNDVTMRDWQFRTTQFLQGKTFEATTPVGPYLVTPEEVDHARDLRMTCEVDGQVMQSASTSELLFSVPALLAYLSDVITLMPGDLIATGTPAGVGAARKPPVYLHPGQQLVSRIDGLGTQLNRCVAHTVAKAHA